MHAKRSCRTYAMGCQNNSLAISDKIALNHLTTVVASLYVAEFRLKKFD